MTKEVSAKLKEELQRIHNSGLNIYALINRTKRELKSVKAHIPDEVLLKLCDVYWCEKNQIRKAFPWFIKVLKMEWMAFNANSTIAEHNQYRNDPGPRGGIEALDAILARVMGKVKKNNNGGSHVESKKQNYVEGQPTIAVKAAVIATSGPGG